MLRGEAIYLLRRAMRDDEIRKRFAGLATMDAAIPAQALICRAYVYDY